MNELSPTSLLNPSNSRGLKMLSATLGMTAEGLPPQMKSVANPNTRGVEEDGRISRPGASILPDRPSFP